MRGRSGRGRRLDLLVDMLDRGADHCRAAESSGRSAKDIVRGVVAVDMGGDEVQRHVLLRRVSDHRIDPRRLRRRRTAHAQPRTHCLYRARRVIVELEVGRLRRTPGPEVDVRLVPHFEIPLRDFVDAIMLDQVPGKGVDQRAPLGRSPWAARRPACTRRHGGPAGLPFSLA